MALSLLRSLSGGLFYGRGFLATYAILATGPSMSQELADYVHGKCRAIAVSDAYKLAPWADALVSNDSSWWRLHKDALKFPGRKFCSSQIPGVEHLKPVGNYHPGTNSGLLAMWVAKDYFKATRLLLLGFDMRGSHYFGPHPEPLKNTTKSRFRVHHRQFLRWKGPPVVNCTPGSALDRFPFSTIEEQLPCLKTALSVLPAQADLSVLNCAGT